MALSEIRNDVFPFVVHIQFGGNRKSARKSFLKEIDSIDHYDPAEGTPENNEGELYVCEETGTPHSLIWFRDGSPSVGIIVHEALHAVIYAFGVLGIPVSAKNDETLAYTLQVVVEKIVEIVNGRE